MKEEKNVTPITIKSWSNPSIGQESNSNLSKTIDENKKEIDSLKEEISELKEEISRLTGDTVEPIPNIVPDITEPEVKEEVKEETKEEIDVPFESPFTEAIEDTPEETNETMQDIVDSVREEVKEEPQPVQEESVQVPMIDIPIEDNKNKISVVVNRYNNDIVASTKGKGAKFVLLSDSEQSKLLSGKINEIN